LQHGDTLSINIELDDVRSGKQIWGQQYTRQTSDLLLVQEDISKEVSSRLRSNLSVADQQKLALGSTTNPEAYQLFLKGQHYTEKFTKDGFDKGIDYLNQAIALDPNYSRAYSALAYNYINQDDRFLEPRKSAPKAREAALKALALNETDAEAHVVLAIEDQWYEWDWVAAEREFKRAIELAPDSGDAHGYYSWFLPSMGRNDSAIRLSPRTLFYERSVQYELRKPKDEGRLSRNRLFQIQATSMFTCCLICDRQPKVNAVHSVGSNEWLKEYVRYAIWHTVAIVFNSNGDGTVIDPECDFNLLRGGTALQRLAGIEQQIIDGGPKSLAIDLALNASRITSHKFTFPCIRV